MTTLLYFSLLIAAVGCTEKLPATPVVPYVTTSKVLPAKKIMTPLPPVYSIIPAPCSPLAPLFLSSIPCLPQKLPLNLPAKLPSLVSCSGECRPVAGKSTVPPVTKKPADFFYSKTLVIRAKPLDANAKLQPFDWSKVKNLGWAALTPVILPFKTAVKSAAVGVVLPAKTFAVGGNVGSLAAAPVINSVTAPKSTGGKTALLTIPKTVKTFIIQNSAAAKSIGSSGLQLLKSTFGQLTFRRNGCCQPGIVTCCPATKPVTVSPSVIGFEMKIEAAPKPKLTVNPIKS